MHDRALGRLVKVDLREIWLSESADFTPWLARQDNLIILGDRPNRRSHLLELTARKGNSLAASEFNILRVLSLATTAVVGYCAVTLEGSELLYGAVGTSGLLTAILMLADTKKL